MWWRATVDAAGGLFVLSGLSVVATSHEPDHYEQWAQDRLTPLLGSLRRTDVCGGPPGMHDFEANLPDGSVAALEVTGCVDDQRIRQEAALKKAGDASFSLPGSPWLWLVRLEAAARVRDVTEARLRLLLSDLEAAGVPNIAALGDYRDPLVIRLRELGIESAWALKPKPGREGTVLVSAGTYGGMSWRGQDVDRWLTVVLGSDQGHNKLAKLGRADASQRHLVLVLDSVSRAGMGVRFALRTRHEDGAADFELPTVVPPSQLTHLWVLPLYEPEGLLWTDDAWSIHTPRV